MYTLNWQPPYDWSWMLGFLAARAVSGVETVADDYYARSLAVGEYRGVVTAIPDIAQPYSAHKFKCRFRTCCR